MINPQKKIAHSSSSIKSTTILKEIIGKTLKNANSRNSGLLQSKKDKKPDIFFILTEDIPAEELDKLTSSRHGVVANLEDDVLKRLLKLEKEVHNLKSLSVTDELTGLYNKRFFNKQMKIEIARTKRSGQSFCLMFIDLDNFKSVNDTLGHQKGDEFLIHLCHLISLKIRPTDFACRYGGDEFTIIMPATSLLDGISIAQRWHELIEHVARKMKVNVSSSIGIDEFDSNCQLSAEAFINKVDKELYNAKKTGKNKVSYPGLVRIHRADARSVTPAEKDALYRAFATPGEKKKLKEVKK
jgi:diguanylate cyclase (GGDEF)-like protein